MRIEDAGRAGHSQQIGVSSQRVRADGVLLIAICALLRVVVLYKGHGILLVVVVGYERLFIVPQPAPVAVVDGITHTVAELEVEGGTRGLVCHIALTVAYPFLDFAAAVPVFSHTEGRLCMGVVVGNKVGIESLHHIIAEARVSYILQQELQVSLDALLHVGALVVQVAAAWPVLARIIVLR